MKKMTIGTSAIQASNIALGCMRMAKKSTNEAAHILNASIDAGIDFFDHADIYGSGLSEEIFAAALQKTSIRRDAIFLQSKCGIRDGFFDFSKTHIIASVERSLQRLKTDYLDTFLLHRPDTLFEPDEVAAAFDTLESSGKVRHFGVSNQNPLQIDLLKTAVCQPLIANQLQFSIMHTGIIDAGFNVNMTNPASVNHDGGILEYSRLNTMTIQAWSPFQYGFFEGVFLNNEKFPTLNATLDRLAEQYHATNTAIATAWILRHPAAMQVIIGTMNPERIRDIAAASTLSLSREEWYEIYRAAGNVLP